MGRDKHTKLVLMLALGAASACTTSTSDAEADKGIEAVSCDAAYHAQAHRPAAAVVTEGAYPPYNLVNDDGELVGWEMDFLAEMMGIIGRDYTLEQRDWDGCCSTDAAGVAEAPEEGGDGLFAATHYGEFDFAIAGMAANGIRRQVLRMSDSYGDAVHQHRIVYRGDLDLTPLTGLDGARLAAQQGTTHYLYLAARYPNAEIVTTVGQDAAFEMLLRGQVDGMLGSSDSSTLGEWFEGTTSFEIDGETFDASDLVAGPEIITVDHEGHDEAYGEGTAVLISSTNSDPTLEKAINCAIAELAEPQADGSISAFYQELNERWGAELLPPGTPGVHGD